MECKAAQEVEVIDVEMNLKWRTSTQRGCQEIQEKLENQRGNRFHMDGLLQKQSVKQVKRKGIVRKEEI